MITLETLKELAKTNSNAEIVLQFESNEEEAKLLEEMLIASSDIVYGTFDVPDTGLNIFSIGIYGKTFHIQRYTPIRYLEGVPELVVK